MQPQMAADMLSPDVEMPSTSTGVDAYADHNEEGLEAQGQQGAKVVLPRGAPLPVDHCGKGDGSY